MISIIKICIIGIIAMLLAQTIKSYRSDIASFLAISGVLIISSYIISAIHELIKLLSELCNVSGIEEEYIKILIKIIGITYISELSADICKDSGYGVIANQIVTYAKLIIISISAPIIKMLITTIIKCFS